MARKSRSIAAHCLTVMMLQCDRATNGAEVLCIDAANAASRMLQCDRATNGAEVSRWRPARWRGPGFNVTAPRMARKFAVLAALVLAQGALQCDRATNGAEVPKWASGCGHGATLQCDRATNGAEVLKLHQRVVRGRVASM